MEWQFKPFSLFLNIFIIMFKKINIICLIMLSAVYAQVNGSYVRKMDCINCMEEIKFRVDSTFLHLYHNDWSTERDSGIWEMKRNKLHLTYLSDNRTLTIKIINNSKLYYPYRKFKYQGITIKEKYLMNRKK